MAANGGSTANRNIPDVALMAEGAYVVHDNGKTGGFGGTSCAAPLWAGFCALVNQQSIAATGAGVGFLNPALYTIAAGPNYTNCLHDITTGNNIGTNTPALYRAVTNYDLCTGLGTPNGTNLINALAPLSAAYTLTWANPAPIIYGAPLTTVQLNASASVPGSFAYSPVIGTVLGVGTNTLSVVFTPSDAADYSSAAASVSLAVLPAPLTVTAADASRPYGQANPAFTGTLTGVTNGDDITAVYACAATPASAVGSYLIVPGLVDPANRQTNYTVTLLLGTLTVAQAAPTLVWTDPAPITYGAPLGSNQLNAAASVPGAFAYSPTNGTGLGAGTNTLSVVFTPSDAVDYSSAAASVSLAVLPAPLTVTAADASRPYGQANPAFTGTLAGVTNGDDITAVYTCAATPASAVGGYLIVPSLVDPANRETNYTVSLISGTLTVTNGFVYVAPAVLWATAPSGGTITLSWSSTAGQTYQVQYSTNLAQGTWTDWLIVTATNSTATASDTLSLSAARFYRTIWLP